MIRFIYRLLGKKTLYDQVVDVLRHELENYIKDRMNREFMKTGGKSRLMDTTDTISIQESAKKLASAWMTTLENDSLKHCSPTMIAAYVLVKEAFNLFRSGHKEASEDYVRIAKIAAESGLPSYGFLNTRFADEEPLASDRSSYREYQQDIQDFKIFLESARLTSAVEGMTPFMTKHAEEMADILMIGYREEGKPPPAWLSN
jgi:hypothetical protein